MKEIYRKSALEKIASVDQLDKALKVTSPLSWLALGGITFILIVTVFWSVTGTLPSTVTSGSAYVVMADTATNTVTTDYAGTVQQVLVGPKDRVVENSQMMTVQTNAGETQIVFSRQYGTVAQVLMEGITVSSGADVVRVHHNDDVQANARDGMKYVVVAYVNQSEIDKIKRGMEVTITLSAADSNTYGHMSGRVIDKDTSPTTTAAIEAVVGSGNSVASAIEKNGPVYAVTCELRLDPGSRSGYFWSNARGRSEQELNHLSACVVKIITEQVPPISKLWNKMKDIIGSR